MPDLFGINHLTLATTDLDRLTAFYTGLLGARLAFERPATPDAPRIAILDVGGADHLMLVETSDPAPPGPDPLGRAGWGLRLATYDQLCTVREVMLSAGVEAAPIETLPTQWTMTTHDPDGRPVDLRVHRPTTPRDQV
ncbi:VOC family protein [Nocardia flavorosea]|uniref:VOC family protein n=1 Tax=Nocardia flavorosea TaxID=53429 RepID=A0A846YM09_9NOCA|nr:VOC family protein [Nocardia flavorosea]NKY58522.1 VOC family protein [Nocardia flavorosea]